MNNYFNGLLICNVELSSLCNKEPGCWCCGRRKLEKEYPELCNWGNMDIDLACNIAHWLPENIIVQFHSNGESLLHPKFGYIVQHYIKQIKCLDTNGKLLIEKANEIIDNLDTLTISVIENDPEGDEQYETVKKFLEIKGDRKPFMIYRLLGDIRKTPKGITTNIGMNQEKIKEKLEARKERWYKLPGIVATRVLHNPMGSFDYEKKVTIPEVGICWEILSHMVINVDGTVSLCVRFDPSKELIIGDIKKEKLIDIWNGEKRKYFLQEHIKGNRKCNPVCSQCDYWGIPRGE